MDKGKNHRMDELIEFYRNHEKIEIFLQLIRYKHPRITLQLIDWFVRIYCDKCRLFFYDDYKFQVRLYGRLRFDIFIRFEKDKINLNYIQTSVGQFKNP